jgi:hypothetical protein
MFSRQEHHTNDQIICWNCEEAVHQSVIACPYCNADLHRHQVQKVSDQTKITPILQQHTPLSPELPRSTESPETAGIGQTISLLGSLFLLLSGSAFFFLAVIIAFFARDGAFTLSWPEHSWSAFFGLGLFLLSLGVMCMQRLAGVAEDSI